RTRCRAPARPRGAPPRAAFPGWSSRTPRRDRRPPPAPRSSPARAPPGSPGAEADWAVVAAAPWPARRKRRRGSAEPHACTPRGRGRAPRRTARPDGARGEEGRASGARFGHLDVARPKVEHRLRADAFIITAENAARLLQKQREHIDTLRRKRETPRTLTTH